MNTVARTLALSGIAALGVATALTAGPLNPPVGAPAGTYKTLAEVEPRRAVQSLPGSANAQYVISEPGSYYLTGPITGVQAKSAIAVAADNVAIDLRGQLITGAGVDGINLSVAHYNLEVRDGVIDRCQGKGIGAEAASNARFRNLRLTQNGGGGLAAGPMSTVEGCQAVSNQGPGIWASDQAVISGCSASFNTGAGISAGTTSHIGRCNSNGNSQGFMVWHSTTVSDCSAADCVNDGFRLLNTNSVTNCSSATNGRAGFYADIGNTFSACTSNGNTTEGFHTGEGNRITGCNANRNGTDGFNAEYGCVLVDNSSIRNGASGAGAGIRVSSMRNRVEGNTVVNNPVGLKADAPSNIFVRNVLGGNSADTTLVPGNGLGSILTAGSPFSSSEPWANLK